MTSDQAIKEAMRLIRLFKWKSGSTSASKKYAIIHLSELISNKHLPEKSKLFYQKVMNHIEETF